MSRDLVRQALEAIGVLLIAAAFAVLWLPLGLIIAGLYILAAANAPERTGVRR